MARKRRQRNNDQDFPGWVWMLFGLAIGLSVALAIYLQDNGLPAPPQQPDMPQPVGEPGEPAAPVAGGPDDDGERTAGAEAPPQRFDFYDMLPNFEVVIPDQESDVTTDTEPQAVREPGVYVLQVGSFSRFEDADRRRAQLALQGIESSIQRVSIDDRTYHRVRIGPIDDLTKLNVLRSRLRRANIDALRIRLGDE